MLRFSKMKMPTTPPQKRIGLGIKVVASVPEGVFVPDESGIGILGAVGVTDLAMSPGIVHIFYHFLPAFVKERNRELPANKNLPFRGGKMCFQFYIFYKYAMIIIISELQFRRRLHSTAKSSEYF